MTNIGFGAEARLVRDGNEVRKIRSPKSYRHPSLDFRLRRFRTRREAKVLSELPVAGPTLHWVDDTEMIVCMSFIDGSQLRDVLDAQNATLFAKQLAQIVSSLHQAGICHGDLTTSNVLVVDQRLHLIDFGLSFFSDSLEDIAVDLHLLKQSLVATHPTLSLWDEFIEQYPLSDELLERFGEVESRGRYKTHS